MLALLIEVQKAVKQKMRTDFVLNTKQLEPSMLPLL